MNDGTVLGTMCKAPNVETTKDFDQKPSNVIDFEPNINSDLSLADRRKLVDLLNQFEDCFSCSTIDLGHSTLVEHYRYKQSISNTSAPFFKCVEV